MKKLIILAILLFPITLSADTVIKSDVILNPVKPIVIKVPLKERIDARIAVVDKTQTETAQKEAEVAIVDEEVGIEVADFAEKIKPIEIDVLQILDQVRELNKTLLSVQESEKLKKVLREIPSQQYPIVNFPFISTASNDQNIYWIDASRWVNVAAMQAEIKDRYIKLAAIGVTKEGGSAYNNWHSKNETLTKEQLSFRAKEYEVLYQAFKQARPDVPVVFVAVMFPNLTEWLNSFTIKPDAWMLMNLDNYEANFSKVKSRWFADKPVIANINYGYAFGEGKEQIYDANFGNTLKALGYSGQVYWRR